MTQIAEIIKLTPEEEARRLWAGAERTFARAEEDFVSLCEALDLGARAVEILAVQRLRSVSNRFPATIVSYLEMPSADVDAHRDAVTVPHSLRFIDIIDLLGDDEAECVSPHLHRGWEDRRFSCRRSRATAREATGVTLDDAAFGNLLVLAAYRNRIFRVQPPVTVKPAEILNAFPALRDLYEGLRG